MKVTQDSSNNFQGRYVILHPWTGAVTCEAPARGRWGGPTGRPAGDRDPGRDQHRVRAARQVELASLVAKDVPSIGVMSSKGLNLPDPVRQPRGCGCRTNDASGALGSLASAGIVGMLLARRRRRGAHAADPARRRGVVARAAAASRSARLAAPLGTQVKTRARTTPALPAATSVGREASRGRAAVATTRRPSLTVGPAERRRPTR